MLNRSFTVLAAAALTLATSVPAFALWLPAIDVNLALIQSESSAIANTGANTQAAMAEFRKADADDVKVSADHQMRTGNAIATAENSVEANKISRETYDDSHAININGAYVGTSSHALANTGENFQLSTLYVKKAEIDNADVYSKGSMDTGSATSTAKNWTVVNSTWSGLALGAD